MVTKKLGAKGVSKNDKMTMWLLKLTNQKKEEGVSVKLFYIVKIIKRNKSKI